jgi:hypothetical protein
VRGAFPALRERGAALDARRRHSLSEAVVAGAATSAAAAEVQGK